MSKYRTRWDEIAREEGTNRSSTDHDYFDLYEALLSHLKVQRLLELGVYQGAGIRTWRRIFPDAAVFGIDCNAFAPVEGAYLFRGDCTDPTMAQRFGDPFDVVVDDASHQTDQILASFDIFAPRVTPGGVYIIEDTLLHNPTRQWYAWTRDVQDGLRERGYAPTILVPGEHWTMHDGEPVGDRGPWALLVVTL